MHKTFSYLQFTGTQIFTTILTNPLHKQFMLTNKLLTLPGLIYLYSKYQNVIIIA